MNQDRLLELVGRKLSGEASEEELRELEQALAKDNDAAERYKLLHHFWEQQDNINQSVIEEGLRNTLSRLDLPASAPVIPINNSRSTSRLSRRWMHYAAAVIVLITGSWVYYNFFSSRSPVLSDQLGMVEKQNSKGVKSTIVLPDGTKVWLNADSRLQYPNEFTGNLREVQLNGEAFFDVVKNPAKPFIIHLANGTVKVLGTSFNIRAYDNEKIVETSVSTGTVAFIPRYEKKDKKQDTVLLTPDKKARYLFGKEEQLITQSTIHKEDKAWTEGKLVFKDMYFEDIAIELERNFGKRTVFLTEAPRRFRLTGSFQNNTLEEIIYYLSKTKDFTYKITNSELLIGESNTAFSE